MNIGDVLDAITNLMATDRTIFVPTALGWMRGLLFLVFVWTIARMAIRGEGFDHWEVIWLLIRYLVLFIILTNWEPTMHLVTDEVRFLRNMVERGQETEVFVRVTGITTEVRSAQPILPSVRDWLVIGTIELVLAVFEAIIYTVLTLGFVAVAICQIIGPLFVSLSIVPAFSFLMNGWSRAFVGYSLYPLFGAIYCNIVVQVLTFFVQGHPPPWSSVDLGLKFAGFVMTFIGLSLGAFLVPTIASHVMGGWTGISAVPKVLSRRF
jgi:hypothetical protein